MASSVPQPVHRGRTDAPQHGDSCANHSTIPGVETVDDLSRQLRALRTQCGRVRGMRLRVQEAIDNIIIDDNAPAEQAKEDDEVVDGLHRKEEELTNKIDPLQADIAEVTVKLDLRCSTKESSQAKERGRSRVGSPTPSARARQ
ncbi:hypothetical protein Pmar_PMAR029175 [Perkinsus marinus ATCC 50983]|uniref:Uncharacterized protein n=1 Tax=Perkinsus marinus (strain ATCC 50983 / TXsc) TaxID=423536 RepID=C5M0U4_PERM5|nr:hypothetical protein Pmar_PMAR029175 [Perkinsus marinus ATCC 50983]EEQ97452.1 hypothetical protein Pmar_PMAR029175 [Perkinsus marinus ATCC 50983]|eukprot:XP_002764735.1 hypothetical protein Pmar_PMAR029175 [Perkinsus marinus ATCC 50983]